MIAQQKRRVGTVLAPDRRHAASAFGLVLNIIVNDGGLVNQLNRSSGVHEGFDVWGVRGGSKKQF